MNPMTRSGQFPETWATQADFEKRPKRPDTCFFPGEDGELNQLGFGAERKDYLDNTGVAGRWNGAAV